MRLRNRSTRISFACMTALLVLALFAPATAFAQDEEIVVATWNLEWFFDNDISDNSASRAKEFSAPNAQEYDDRVVTIADAIAEIDPTILALQEIENDVVVQDLAAQLATAHGLIYTVAFVQGLDTATEQDVAFLLKEGVTINDPGSRFEFTPELDVDGVTRNVSKHLRIDVTIDGEAFTIVTTHLLSRNPSGRLEQARTMRTWITTAVDPAAILIILGDFNAGQRYNQTTPDSEIGILRGFLTQETTDDLIDAHEMLGDRATHVNGREYDRILMEAILQPRILGVETRSDLATRGDEDSGCDGVCYPEPIETQDLSDHYPLVVTLAASTVTEETVEPAEPTETVVAASAASEADTESDDQSAPEASADDVEARLNARLDALEAEIRELRSEIAEIKALILALNE